MTKICTKCGKELPLDSFYRSRDGKHGRRAACKECSYKAEKRYSTKGLLVNDEIRSKVFADTMDMYRRDPEYIAYMKEQGSMEHGGRKIMEQVQ